MSWSLTKRRVAATSVTTALVVAALLGSSLGTIARETAAPKKTPHALSTVVSFTKGLALTVTVEQPFYDANAQVLYAEVDDVSGNPIGCWLPYSSTPPKTGQVVRANRITVALNTTTMYALPVAPNQIPSVPLGIYPPIGSGSILLIHTNVDTDAPPTAPIQLDPVALAL